MKILTLLVLLLVGCANVQSPPNMNYQSVDCINQQAHVRYWLQYADTPKQIFETQEDYENSRRAYRARAWHIRSVCNPVR